MDDDWVISSMKRYDQLFMYDVAYPIQGFDWTVDQTGLWVYSTFDNGRTELNLLQLPEKIVSQSLTGHRDFKIVSGVLVPTDVSCIKAITNSFVAVGNACNNCVNFWTRDSETEDLLVEQNSFTIPSSPTLSSNIGVTDIVPSAHHNNLVAIQGRAGCLSLLDTPSGCVTWQRQMNTCVIHGACFFNPDNLLVCYGNNGDLMMCDLRQVSLPPLIDDTNAVASSPITFSSNNNSVLTFSDKLRLYDTRSLSTPFAIVAMKHDDKTDSPLCIKFGIVDCNRISVSGNNIKGVEVYDTKEWSGNINDPAAIFIHDGHEAEDDRARILIHGWHHLNERMLISAATDGSLHAWQYNKDSIAVQ